MCLTVFDQIEQVWLTMVSTLACFNIGKAKDEFGHEIELNGEYYTEGVVT